MIFAWGPVHPGGTVRGSTVDSAVFGIANHCHSGRLLTHVGTVPVPGAEAKFAVAAFAASIVTAQPADPVHAPLQPLNTMPLAGVAVSVTAVPLA
jgi:hypothetical protein